MTERELARGAARRLAIIRHVQEVTGNVALTCRYYGITRQCYYVWFRRYEEFGVEGLRDRSSRPHVSPKTTREEVVGKIIYLRQNYHFGPHKIAMYLERYHEIKVSPSGIWRILKRLDMSRLPASQRYKRHKERWKRYEKPQPGHRVQVDVKFVAPIGGTKRKHYQFTAIDDCTRLRVLRVYDHLNQKTAIQFIDYVFEKLPFRVEVIQTDNGAEFQSAFHWHVLDRGVQHVYIKPATPRLNGKVETIASDRRRRVLPAPGWRGARRRPAVHHQAPGVGGLLQFRPPARRLGWPNSLRATTPKDRSPCVIGHRQLHS